MESVLVAELAAAAERSGIAMAAGSVSVPAGLAVARPAALARLVDAITVARQHAVDHVIVRLGNRHPAMLLRTQLEAAADLLRAGAERSEAAGVRLHIEPSNRRDEPDYLLCDMDQAKELVTEVNNAHLDICAGPRPARAAGALDWGASAESPGLDGPASIRRFEGVVSWAAWPSWEENGPYHRG